MTYKNPCPKITFTDNVIEEALKSGHNYTNQLKSIEDIIDSKGLFIDTTKISAAARHVIPSQNRHHLREIHENQRFFEEVSRHLIKNYSLSGDEVQALRHSNVEQHRLVRRKRQTCRSQQPINCFRSRFRTFDGSCNNERNPRWGKSFECVARLLDPNYADGVSAPRVSRSGRPLPNPRSLSVAIHPQEDVSANFSHMVMQFGQFLDHDISLSPVTQLRTGGVQCCPRPTHPDCFEIPVPGNDQFFNRMGQRCINFVRSVPCESCRTGHRLQLNELTAFIDASNIYGSSINESFGLRDKNGLLAVGFDKFRRPILPPSNNIGNDQCSRPNKLCFRAGDNSRVNQHPALTALHTIWMRQHNRVASAIKQLNPLWDGERVYQESRRIIGAQMQMITYNEFLPIVLGPKVMQFYKLNVQTNDNNTNSFTRYDPSVNPSILSEFSSAAFRFGHSIVNGRFSLISSSTPSQKSSFNLRDNFFTANRMHSGQMDAILRGLVGRSAQRFDPFCHGDLRNHLYQQRGQLSGSDLPAMNIQRGRDHGLPGYVHYLKHCFKEDIKTFEQLDQYMPSSQRQRFQQSYQHVEDIDLFSGGISELPLSGAIVGPTFACIIGTQFNHLKYGDRFYFEHKGQPGSFTSGQLKAIRGTLFARIVCINGNNFKEIHSHIFQLNSDSDPIISCDDIPDIDISQWRDA
ncbi:peroxidasin homolog [Oppia nitens]|uniref:peroxidasin homolog n=1 Tax=Oppia nitens TaxID=1686743 RepID=UPI0023DADA8C|nr:peroxidasin homolog [Oppia nitens]